jgi:hypothetical protein
MATMTVKITVIVNTLLAVAPLGRVTWALPVRIFD